MLALDIVNKKIINWNHREYKSVQIPLDMLEEIIAEPEKSYEIIKLNHCEFSDEKYYENSLHLFYDFNSIYVKTNADGTISKIGCLKKTEHYNGHKLTKEEDLILCYASILQAGFYLLEDIFYQAKDYDAASIDFIIEGMGRIWREIENAKNTE